MDAETQQVAEKLARFVADGGPEVEALAAERNRDNPAFRSVAVYVTLFLIFTLFSVIYLTQNIFCPSLVSYMTSKVQPSASTKRKYRSVVLQRPRALHLQQLSQGETSIDQLRRHYWESLHRWTTLLHPTFRRERLRLSNGRGRVDGGLRMTKSNCPFLPSLSLKSSLFRIPTLPLSLVLNC